MVSVSGVAGYLTGHLSVGFMLRVLCGKLRGAHDCGSTMNTIQKETFGDSRDDL